MQDFDPATALLEYLTHEFSEPDLAFDATPVRLTGGYDTAIYRFRLAANNAAPSDLVLRLYPGANDVERARTESAVQNALASSDVPAPRVFFTRTDESVLGRPFIVMAAQRIPAFASPLLLVDIADFVSNMTGHRVTISEDLLET